mmetsp:Transcript_28109/g.76000  ORF Transcript_28109/g.76000 Transcript_28109/m.76000 type:complete len:266 (-) Transcript_28109:388-1185(-)
MNFSTKKRPRKNAWKELQQDLDDREKMEEENVAKFARMDRLKARSALEDECDPEKTHAYMDIVIGRDQGKNPELTRGRLIFELFDDIMPRTADQFVRMVSSSQEPTYYGSAISTIFPGEKCVAGDRESRIEGAVSGRDQVFSRVEQEANWQVPHLNPGVLSLYDFKTSKFIITFKQMEQLDGWHPVFGKTVYGFDVLREISDRGTDNGTPKLPVTVVGGGSVPRGTHPREYLKALEKAEDKEEGGGYKKVMRYSSTYRHTGLIGH